MNAPQIAQMVAPAGIVPDFLPLNQVPVGTIIVFPGDFRNRLHLVSRHGRDYLYFRVLADGTISSTNPEFPKLDDFMHGVDVAVYRGSQLPDLKSVDGNIVWAES